jgi:DNA-binding transcriptional ArsR family regulator
VDAIAIVTEPRRREILRLVWDDERPVGDLVERLGISFSAVSQHLAVLRDAGYVRVFKDGNHRRYRADKEALGELRVVLEGIWSASLDSVVQAIEEDGEKEKRP